MLNPAMIADTIAKVEKLVDLKAESSVNNLKQTEEETWYPYQETASDADTDVEHTNDDPKDDKKNKSYRNLQNDESVVQHTSNGHCIIVTSDEERCDNYKE